MHNITIKGDHDWNSLTLVTGDSKLASSLYNLLSGDVTVLTNDGFYDENEKYRSHCVESPAIVTLQSENKTVIGKDEFCALRDASEAFKAKAKADALANPPTETLPS
mgnify:CR=1 FL=1